MKSSLVALVVFVLGLSATTLADQDQVCHYTCDTNITAIDFNNNIKIELDAEVTIIYSKTSEFLIFINSNRKLIIAFDVSANSSFMLIYTFDAKIAIVFDLKNNTCVKVQLNISVSTDIDFTAIRNKFNEVKNSSGSVVLTFISSFVFDASFDSEKILKGPEETVTEVITTYKFFFEATYNARRNFPGTISFVGATVFVGLNEVPSYQASFLVVSINTVSEAGVNITGIFVQYLFVNIQSVTDESAIKFQIAFKAANGDINKAISEINSVKSFSTSLSIGLKLRIAVAGDYVGCSFAFRNIDISVGYSAKTLAVYNARANIIVAVSRDYTFIYSTTDGVGLLFKSSLVVFVNVNTIREKLGKTIIDAGALAVFISAHGKTVFDDAKQNTLKSLKIAFESLSDWAAFCKTNAIGNSTNVYKSFREFAISIQSSLLTYRFDVTISLRVSFSLNKECKRDDEVYNNSKITAIAVAFTGVTTIAPSSTSFFNAVIAAFPRSD